MAALQPIPKPETGLSIDKLVKTCGVTPKQANFVLEYLVDLNGKQAAIRAKYAPKSAEVQASVLLRNPKVAAALQLAREDLSARHTITLDAVIRQLGRLGFSDPRKMFNADGSLKSIHELDDDTAAALAGFEVEERTIGDDDNPQTVRTTKVRWAEKKGPLETLGKHLGLKTESDAPAGAAVAVKVYLGFDPDSVGR